MTKDSSKLDQGIRYKKVNSIVDVIPEEDLTALMRAKPSLCITMTKI